MLTRESLSTDVLVIGSGVAGTMAALEARRGGAQVILVSKAGLGKEASTAYALAAFQSRHLQSKLDLPGYDSKPGKYIEDPAVVEAVDKEALNCIHLIEKLGVPMLSENGYDGVTKVYRPVGSDQGHGGAIILNVLGALLRSDGVRVVEDCLITGLLKEDGSIIGASGLRDDGRWLSIFARATIVATGGAAGIYQNTTTSKSVLGDGYALALQAGAKLTNLEFIHFYPVGLSTPGGQYVHCAPGTLLMEKARIINSKGEDIIQKHYHITLQEGTIPSSTRFEWLPRAVAMEAEAGPVLLDLTQVPARAWEKLPERNHKQIRRSGADMRVKPVPILHMGHSFRGGIPIDARGRTSMPGLYAAGEVTSGYFAAESGWGPFPSCLITGAIAGRSAAADLDKSGPARERKGIKDGLDQIEALAKKEGNQRASELQEQIRQICYRSAGPVKTGPLLEEGLKRLKPLEEASDHLRCENIADLKGVIETKAMLSVGRAVMEVT
ncbi:MAG: FAD-binding protein, partial [Dehalococcoidia bacterium]|nr:FAD-binding protein [Dehalococcoidia bacterium]